MAKNRPAKCTTTSSCCSSSSSSPSRPWPCGSAITPNPRGARHEDNAESVVQRSPGLSARGGLPWVLDHNQRQNPDRVPQSGVHNRTQKLNIRTNTTTSTICATLSGLDFDETLPPRVSARGG